jgi:methylmalonyl-CoA/ethylmalonyl-CoA epimerase
MDSRETISFQMSELSLHHVGHVVRSIDDFLSRWRLALGVVPASEIVEDPIQQVKAVFVSLPPEGSVQFELIEPAGPKSPVRNFAERGGGLHHMCFEVDDLEQQLEHMKSLKATLVRAAQPAVAFGGRRIAWVHLRENLLLEYLERSPKI